MRIPIAIVVAASLAVSAAPAIAQETNTANATETGAPAADANLTAAVPPVDGNMAVTTEVAPAETMTAAEEPYAAPRAAREKRLPWGLLGLLGLVGLLGRRRSDRS